MAPFFTGAK